MSGLNHGWDKDDPNHADFIHGGVDADDFDKVVNYAPRRKKKGCKKGRGEPCKFTKKVIRNQWWSARMEKWAINSVMVCERCGKQDWSTYSYGYSNSPAN